MVTRDLAFIAKESSLRKAEKIVNGYKIIIDPNEKFGFVGSAVEFPNGFGKGNTQEDCLKDTRQILILAIGVMLDNGGTPPEPMSTQCRTAQINVRVNQFEKDLISKAAVRLGFRGIGDFLRTAAMESVRSLFK
jgi:predicted RNase H-like HicB family nuclease